MLGAVGLLISLQNVADMLMATPSFVTGPWAPSVAWVASTFVFPVAIMLGILLVLIFPDGRLVSPTWGLPGWLAAIGCALLIPYQGFAPGNLPWYRDFPNSFALPPGSETWLVVGRYLGVTAIGSALILAGWALVIRYRAADEVLRQQLKWFVYGSAVLVITAVAQIIAFVTLPHDHPLGEITLAGLFIGGALLPVAAAVAITRFGLYEIDVLIDRTFVYGALTAVLAGLYAAGIRFFNAVFVGLTGQESDGALVLTTLVLATTFTPIKGRLEKIVARRYDRASTPAPLAAPPGAPLDEAALRALVADLVREELARRSQDLA